MVATIQARAVERRKPVSAGAASCLGAYAVLHQLRFLSGHWLELNMVSYPFKQCELNMECCTS